MWGVTGESGEIENPALVPPLKKILQVCKVVEETPDKSVEIKLRFVKGLPVELDGKPLDLVAMIHELNQLGATHGVGVTHHIEDRVVGLKVRGLYEAPAPKLSSKRTLIWKNMSAHAKKMNLSHLLIRSGHTYATVHCGMNLLWMI